VSQFLEIGNRLRAHRLGSGLSLDVVAKRLRVSRSAIYRHEAGEVVKIETVQRIARLLNVSLAALLGVGIEHIANAFSFFERLHPLEAEARALWWYSVRSRIYLRQTSAIICSMP
jgi:transcriptional regulator with XRE-family HTH domain